MDRAELAARLAGWIEHLDGDARGYLNGRGLTDDTIESYFLGYVPVSERFYGNHIAIPYYSAKGSLRTVRFRNLAPKDKTDRYRNLPLEKGHVFNVGSVRHHTVFITEGEFDCLVLVQEGIPAVAVARLVESVAEDVEIVNLPDEHDVSSLYVENRDKLLEIVRQYDD